MKIRLYFKDPDGVDESLKNAVEDSRPEDIRDAEWAELKQDRVDSLAKKLASWIEYREYLTVEIDTEADTASVIKVKQ